MVNLKFMNWQKKIKFFVSIVLLLMGFSMIRLILRTREREKFWTNLDKWINEILPRKIVMLIESYMSYILME